MQETFSQVTYALLSSRLGASEFMLGLVVAAGFMVSGVQTLCTRRPDGRGCDERRS